MSSAQAFDWLVEWDWPATTYRYSKHRTVVTGGNTYAPRILSVRGLGGMFIDRKEADFPTLDLTLCNLADDGSTSFPFHLLDAADDFEDKEIRVYLYDATTDTKYLYWFGITKRPEFDPEEFTCTISATFPWDAIDIKIPAVPLGHLCQYAFGGSNYETAGGTVPSPGCPYATYGTPGFTSCGKTVADCTDRGMLAFISAWTHIAPVLHDDTNNLVERDKVRAGVVPLIYGTGDIKIKPEIYRAVIRQGELICNFIISGTHNGLPFDASQVDASRLKLGGVTRATYVEFYTGVINQAIPGNRTLFPEEAGHSFVAYGVARFPLTKEQIDKFSDNVPFHAIRARIDGGRKTLRSSGQTENPVYVLEDVLRDPIYGLGLPAAQIDSSITAAASYVGARFRGRFEIDKPEPLIDYVQRCLGTWGGFITFNDGVMQIGAKRDDETGVATFGTGGGRKIVDHEAVSCSEEDFSDLVNDLVVRYRAKMRQKREFAYADYGAQIKAGNGLKKVSTEEIFLEGIYDDDEAAIAAAVWLREEQNLNLTISFKTPLNDWQASGARAGDVIRVNSPHIWNNGSNYLFRVTGFDVDTEGFLVTIRARVYKQSVYAYNADPIDGDILRDGGDTSIAARPPDVTSVAASIVDVFTDDDDDRMARIHCTWTYPDVSADHTQDNAEGIYPEYPIEAVKTYWRYTDESINDLKLGTRVQYPTAAADLVVPFHRSRQVEVWFVAVGRNNGQGELGYVIDPAQTTYLDGDLDATSPTFDVGSTTAITAGEYLRCESELMLVDSVSSPSVTVADSGGDRAPQFDTDVEAHPDGTEIGVALKSHPTATVDMTSRRHTLAKVTGVVTRSRPRGVRVKWTNLPDYDAEKYFLYWSVTGALDDADAWVASWSSQDPKSPTSGINLVKCGKKAHHLIPQEDIDTAFGGDASGVDVQVRVTAKIKNNYSSALSDLPGSSPGHHNRPWAAPGDPILADISQEVIDTSDRVRVTVRVYATSDRTAGGARSFEDVNTHIIGLRLQKWIKLTSSWAATTVPFSEEVEDPSATYQDIEFIRHRGSRWRIVNAWARNPGTRRVASSTVNVAFDVGDETDDIDTITDLTIQPFGTDEDTESIELDARHSQLLVTFTQPATPVSLKRLKVFKKRDDLTNFNQVPGLSLIDDDDMQTAGAKEIRVTVQHPKNQLMDYKVRLVATDGTYIEDTLDQTSPDEATGAGDDPIRSDAHGPSYPSSGHVVRNHVVGANAGSSVVDFVYTPFMDGTTGDNTWDAPDATFGPVRHITLKLRLRNAANTAYVSGEKPIRITVHASEGTGSLAVPFEVAGKLEIGQVYWIAEIAYHNGTDELIRASSGPGTGLPGTDVFVAGASSYGYDATALTSTSATADTATSADNRNSMMTTLFTQPATPVLLQSATYEVSVDGGTTWKHRKTRHLLGKAPKFSVTGAKTLIESIQHRKNISSSNLKFRVILTPFGATYETGDAIAAPNLAITTTGYTSADDGYAVDNNNPATVCAAPTFKKAYIGNGGLSARFARPADARPYLQYLEVQFSDNSSATITVPRDWLNPEDGTAAYTATNPNVDAVNTNAVNLANATGRGSTGGRYESADLRKRDLDATFQSGTAHGTLTLFVRGRYVDLDAAGTLRYGDWSTWQTVTAKATMDRDTDTPTRNHAAGTGNHCEGFGCSTDASTYPAQAGAHGNTNTLGLNFYIVPRNNEEDAAIRTFAASRRWVNGTPGSYTAETGNPWDSVNRGIYWEKTVPCISVYGQATGLNHYNIGPGPNTGTLVTPAINCRIPSNVRQGETWWFTVAVASAVPGSLGSISGMIVALWDRASGVVRGQVTGINITFPNTDFKLLACKLNITSNFTGNCWLQIVPPTFTPLSANGILYFTQGIFRRGPTPPRVWVPGRYEANVDAATGVSLAPFRNLQTIDMSGGWGADAITTFGELDL